MNRLFLRFFFGVVAILVVAAIIQGYVLWYGARSQNEKVFRQLNFGGMRIARDQMTKAEPANIESTLAMVKQAFDFPVRHVRLGESATDQSLKAMLESGEPTFVPGGAGVSFNGNTEALVFGPFPEWYGPNQFLVMLATGFILSMAAIAIAFLLRPVVRQLRKIERAALAISAGDLSARIVGNASNSVPIASAFNTMADQTEALLKSQRELLQSVSHELRTPLARIRFATELVETAQTDQQRKQRLESIDNATEELDSLVGELLSFVRIDSGAVGLEFEAVCLEGLISDVIESYSPLHSQVNFKVDCDASIQVEADRRKLNRAIGNLVSNAGRFADSQVKVSVVKDDKLIFIRVDDDGEGIAEADRESIFEPFVRLENNSGQGFGLGLALVKRIVDQHKGIVQVDRSSLGGTLFEMQLPIVQQN